MVGEKLLFIESVADAFGDFVGIPFEPVVHVVGGEKFLPVGKGGIRFDKILCRALGMDAVEGAEGNVFGRWCFSCGGVCRLRSGSKSEGGEGVCDALSLFALNGLSGGVFFHAADTDGCGIRTHDFGGHVDTAVIITRTSLMKSGDFGIASPRRPEGDGLFLLLMCVFGECAVCAERLAGTDGAVRVRCVAVHRDAVSCTNCGGQGGGDRLL